MADGLRPVDARPGAPPQADAGLRSALEWSTEPWVIALMLAALGAYALGTWRVWHRAGWGRGVQWRQAAAFGSGWLALGVALVSPLDSLDAWLFSAHMVQHELLMIGGDTPAHPT